MAKHPKIDGHKITGGLQFQVGHQMTPRGVSVVLILKLPSGTAFPSYWSPTDADAMASYLQKHAELARRVALKEERRVFDGSP